MLILTRKKDESILIGKDIIITILGSKSGQVRVGITAPIDIPVMRDELLDYPLNVFTKCVDKPVDNIL